MTPARTFDPKTWVMLGAALAFVVVTHFVHVAAGAPPTFLVLETGIGLLFVACGAIAWRRRPTSPTGPLLVLCGPLWMLGGYNPAGIETLWVVGFAFEGYYDIVFAFLALTFPAARLGAGRYAIWALAGAFAVRSLGRIFLQDPARTYPEMFPAGSLTNPFAVFESRTAFEAVESLSSAAIAAIAVIVAVMAAHRLLRSEALTRAVIGPVIGGAMIAMAFAALGSAETAWTTATGAPLLTVPEPLTGLVDWLIPAARATVPLAFLAGTLRIRSADGPLATMASRLEYGGSPAEVDDALAAYIENEQLASLLRAQLAELRASRARIVAAGDAERRRIERALHDGAQQHLTGVAIRLDEARRSADSDPSALSAKLAEIATDLRDAMHELRELARGIHPTILTEAGLAPAIGTLARRSPVPVEVRMSLDGRMPLPTEVTAYYLVAEALTNVARSARAGRAEVTLERQDDGLFIRVQDDGVGGADPVAGSGIEGLRDRVRALNGRFSLTSLPGRGTTLEAWLPCE